MSRGMGRVFQPTYKDKRTGELKTTNTWRWELWVNGKRHSGPAPTEAAANRILKRKIAEAGVGQFIGNAAERMPYSALEDLIRADYKLQGRKSLRRAEISMVHLRAAFGTDRAVRITSERVSRYITTRLDGGAKPATVQKELAALRRMFTLAVRARKLTFGHVPYIPTLNIQNTRSGFFEDAEYQAIRRALSETSRSPEDVQAVTDFMYWTGWRTKETLGLQWRQVDFAHGVIRLDVGSTKNDEGRELPFAVLPELRAVLERQRARTEAVQRETGQILPWVFHRGGKPIKDFLTGWHQACAKSGLSGRLPHDFRRTAVRRYERAGVSRSVAMKLTGHKTESVYRRYAIVASADLRDGLGKVAALTPSKAPAAQVVALASAHAATAQVPPKSRRPAVKLRTEDRA
jgi:integrase